MVLEAADRARVNEFVAASPAPHFKQLGAWGEVLDYDGTQSVWVGVERDGHLCASVMLYVRRIPGTRYTLLSGSRGPILDFRDDEALACLVAGVRQVAREHRAVFVRVDPELADEAGEVHAALTTAGFVHLPGKKWSDVSDPRIVVTLDIVAAEDELFRGLRETHRRHVRGAVKKSLGLRLARDVGDVLRFREIMLTVGERRGFPVRSATYYERLWSHFLQAGDGALVLAEKDGHILAGLLTIAVGARAWLLYTGLDDGARALHPNEAVWWEALRWARRRGARLFNFGGAATDWPPAEDSPGWPVYNFKRGFGAEAVLLTGYYDLVVRPSLYRGFRLLEERVLPRVAGAAWFRRLVKG